MTDTPKPDDIRAAYLVDMGADLGNLYYLLWNEVAWAHAKWNQYRQLYAKGPETIELMNRTAGFFFQMLNDVLWEDTLLHLARLTDPPEMGKHKNLAITCLGPLIPEAKLRTEVEDLVADALARAEFARTWRHKHIAHRDLLRSLAKRPEPLPPASRQKVGEALAAIARVMNALEAHYRDTEVAFDGFIAAAEADAMLSYLELGVDAEDRRRERLREGRPLPEDLGPRLRPRRQD